MMEKKRLIDYSAIKPTIMDSTTVHKHLRDILQASELNDIEDKEIAEALLEMIFRLSDTYSVVEDSMTKHIFSWVQAHWAVEPIEYVDVLGSILANLGTPKTIDFVKEKMHTETNEQVRRILQEVLQDLT